MNILIITPIMSKNIGGQERFVLEFSSEAAKLGNKVTILTSRHRVPLNIKGVRIIRHNILFPRLFNKLVKYMHLSLIAKNHIKKNKYDAVFALGYSGLFLENYIWRATGSPVPKVKRMRKKLNRKKGIITKILSSLDLFSQEIMEKICIKKGRIHMFPSVALKNEFERYYHFRPEKLFIPCSGSFLIKKRTEKNKSRIYKWDKIKDKIKILTVGGLCEDRKGRNTIISALPLLKENVVLVSAGKISDYSTISRIAKKNIINLGKVEPHNMREVYENCDIFISASIYEGFPNSIIEAASYGIPIISTDITGISEYFKDNEIIIIEKNNPHMLAKAISKLAGSEKRRKIMGKKAKKSISRINYKKFTKKVMFLINNSVKEVNMLE